MPKNKNAALVGAATLLIGTAAGIIAGILFAPAGGKKTRRMIQEEINKTGEKAKEIYEKIVK